MFDFGGAPARASATATNVTVLANGAFVNGADLTLDSSIVGGLGIGSDADCTITHSRGPTMGTDPTGCDAFQTTADPMFVDPANGDLHLAAGSPMIDLGNPAPRPRATVDFDGDPRETPSAPSGMRRPPRHRRRRVRPGLAVRLRRRRTRRSSQDPARAR